MEKEYAVELATSNLRFGAGATREIGMDLADRKISSVLLLTDSNLVGLAPVTTARQSLEDNGISYELFDRVRVEPTDGSFRDAIDVATKQPFDAFVAVGGGSVMDTAKAANLYSSQPADFLDYVNPPVGKGLPVPGPLKPLFAIPTTAGTGSETTGVAIFDFEEMHAKTGIAHRMLKPTLGILDPENTRTLPPEVAASTGLDVLSHAIESYTAMPYTDRPRPAGPLVRPAYQGSNPISDVWSLEALRMVREYLPRAAEDPCDDEARGMMLLAAALRRRGLRERGRALAAWHVVPGFGDGEELSARGVRSGSSACAARGIGDSERTGRVSVYRVGEPRAAPEGGGGSGRGRCRRRGIRRREGLGRHHHGLHAEIEGPERLARAGL